MRHPFREIIPPVDFFSDFAAYGTDKWASITSPTQMSIVDDPVTGAARKVLRMEVPDSYTSGPTINPRCQLSTANAIRAGSDFWLGFGLYLPSGDYHLDASRAWIAFVQLYGAPFTGYPPFRIAFEGPGPTGDRAGFGWKREPAMGDDWACLIAPKMTRGWTSRATSRCQRTLPWGSWRSGQTLGPGGSPARCCPSAAL
jgi:hypothetical protein